MQLKCLWKTEKNFDIKSSRDNLFTIIFYDENDMEFVLEGCAWLFRRQLILFERLLKPLDRGIFNWFNQCFG